MLSLANGMTPFSLLCLALRMRKVLLGDFEPHIHTTFPPMYYFLKENRRNLSEGSRSGEHLPFALWDPRSYSFLIARKE